MPLSSERPSHDDWNSIIQVLLVFFILSTFPFVDALSSHSLIISFVRSTSFTIITFISSHFIDSKIDIDILDKNAPESFMCKGQHKPGQPRPDKKKKQKEPKQKRGEAKMKRGLDGGFLLYRLLFIVTVRVLYCVVQLICFGFFCFRFDQL